MGPSTQELLQNEVKSKHIFEGLSFHFYLVGDKFHSLQNAITQHGGSFTFVITENTTHVITSLKQPDEVIKASFF
jgi:hypothetical protein